MFDFQQKRKIRAVLESRVTWTIISVLTILMLISAYDRYQIARDMAERRSTAEHELEALRARKVELETDVQYLSGERGMEAEMRRQFDIAKEGEQVVIIVGEEAEPKTPTSSTTTAEKRPWYRFW